MQTLNTLFVYGTLRRDFGHPLHDLLNNHFQFIGKGSMKGDLFDIGSYPGVVSSKKSKRMVVGEIYIARDKKGIDSILKILDEYEGYDKTSPAECEYVRTKKWVKLNTGVRRLSWLYLYNRSVENKKHIAGGDYIRYLAKNKQI